jgi:hypothetical protein
VSGNDDNCNGTANEGCSCINSVTTQSCGYCGDGSQTCTDGKTNTYSACTGGTPGQDFTPLALTNGWTNAPFSTTNAAISLDCSGIVHFKGAISGGTTMDPFAIPAGLQPTSYVYVPVDMFAASKGRLNIAPTGAVTVQPYGATTDATSFTSLEGVSYAVSANGFTPLALNAGWTNAPFSTRNAAVSVSNGIVRFEGGITSSGTNPAVFTIPAAFCPPVTVYMNVDMMVAAQGRIYITPAGDATVQVAGGNFTSAANFTSLEGVWYPLTSTNYTALSLINGWTNAPFSTRNAAVSVSNGIVRFQGAIGSGTTTSLFALPAGMRPATNVYTPIGLCGAVKGRLNITPAGDVSVQAFTGATAGGAFSDAQCFTSLEGVSFGL